MKNQKYSPKDFLDLQELSVLENYTIKAGQGDVEVKKTKEKKKIK